jgi:hypothetical protein
MSLNEAGWDRIARVVGGAILLILAFTSFNGAVALIAGLLGGVFLVTGLVGWCPLYALFKVSTRREETPISV